MLDKMLDNMVPVLLLRVSSVAFQDKQKFADLLNRLTAAYLNNDLPAFSEILSRTSFSIEWKQAIIKALWPEAPMSGK